MALAQVLFAFGTISEFVWVSQRSFLGFRSTISDFGFTIHNSGSRLCIRRGPCLQFRPKAVRDGFIRTLVWNKPESKALKHQEGAIRSRIGWSVGKQPHSMQYSFCFG